MNNALEEIKTVYKPYRYTKKKNVTIINSTKGSYVIKEKENNKVSDTYNYLLSRNFDYFPKITNEVRQDVNVFEYIEEIKEPVNQKALDLIDLVALLHNKTTYYKEVSQDKFKEIYENLENNINYTENYYNGLFDLLITEVYPSPSEYLLIRNIYKIFAALDYCKDLLEDWFTSVSEDLKTRVALIHNNLEIDHYLHGDRGYLISWEKAIIDSPIMDLINFYQKEYLNIDFGPVLKKYLASYPLKDKELNLFFIVISIPPIIELEEKELDNIKNIREKLDYVFKTENLITELKASGGDK